MVLHHIISLKTAGTGQILMMQTVHGSPGNILLSAEVIQHINYQLSDFWLTNITYLRVRNIEIGYNSQRISFQGLVCLRSGFI